MLTDHDRAPPVPGEGVVSSRPVHVPPEHHRALRRLDVGADEREHSVAASLEKKGILHIFNSPGKCAYI